MMRVSADWPGVTAAEVEKSLGEGSVCLFLNGAEGDASPNGVDDKQGDEKIGVVWAQVAEAVRTGALAAHTESAPSLAVWSIDRLHLPDRKPNALFIAAAGQLGATFRQARELVDTLMPQETSVTWYVSATFSWSACRASRQRS